MTIVILQMIGQNDIIKMLRAIKIRLYTNKTQEQTLNKALWCYRFVYNQMLAQKQNAYKADNVAEEILYLFLNSFELNQLSIIIFFQSFLLFIKEIVVYLQQK